MNLPPPVKCAAYNKLQKKIHLSVKEVATEVMQVQLKKYEKVPVMMKSQMCQYRVMVPGRSVVLRHSMEL